MMNRQETALYGVTLLLLGLGVFPSSARAGVIAVDMDPTTAGIQTSFSVTSGAAFGIDIVWVGDGVSVFDLFTAGVLFGTPATVIDPGNRFAGTVAGAPTIPAANIDLGSGLPNVGPGSPLTIFAGTDVGIGTGFPTLVDFLGGPAPTPPPGGFSTILVSIPLIAGSVGSSTVSLSATTGVVNAIPFPAMGTPMFTLAGGSLTVTPAVGGVVPEPTTLFVWGFASVAMVGFGRNRQRRRATAA